MQEIKVILHDIMKEKYKKEIENKNPEILDIGIKLRMAGVSETFIGHLSTWLSSLKIPIGIDFNKEESSEKIKEFYLSSAIKFIFKQIHVTGSIFSDFSKQKIICVVGATGVGKTTTLAKIAAKLKISHNISPDLVSMDTYRVAASDQLRVYSKILECSFSEAQDSQDLLKNIQRKNRSPVVLIDTAGRNIHQPEQKELLKQLSALPLPIEFHLVLSSTMKQRDIDETMRNYKFLQINSLIFTKLDESWAFGEILNTTAHTKIPLSYFTTGQRVPEDIEIASKERVVERLLRL